MSPTAVRGVVLVDLAPHVNQNGWITTDAREAVHRVLATCPAHVAIRVDLGPATWLEPAVLQQLAELTATAGSVEVVGSDPDCLGRVVAGLRTLLGSVAA